MASILKIKDKDGNWVSVPAVKGDKGDKGDTPKREVDYWTDEDKNEIKSYVEDAIIGGKW